MALSMDSLWGFKSTQCCPACLCSNTKDGQCTTWVTVLVRNTARRLAAKPLQGFCFTILLFRLLVSFRKICSYVIVYIPMIFKLLSYAQRLRDIKINDKSKKQ